MAVMQSAMRKMMLVASSLLLVGCAGSTRVLGPTVGCSSLIPNAWREDVPSAVQSGQELTDWMEFGLAQTGQLGIANTRNKGAIEIVEACEARDRSAVREIERPWWQRLFS